MRIIPVLDLRAGLIVRGIAGRRSEYRPIVSRLAPSAEPLEVARGFRSQFGLTQLYLADLDAISGATPAAGIYRQLQDDGFTLWVDAGLAVAADAEPLLEAGVTGVIAGLETFGFASELGRLVDQAGPERVVFSLDLKDGHPLGSLPGWTAIEPPAIAAEAIAQGVRRLIVLDVARVGVQQGIGTEELCARLSRAHPEVEIIAGGGIRSAAEVSRLQQVGVTGVLLASALHDGQITPEEVRQLGGTARGGV